MIKEVIKILDGFKDKKILVIGDIMLDYFRWCEVNKINPEQPVAPNVDSIEETYALGGAGNVANNIVSLGAKCCLYGILGVNSEKREDGYGKRIKKICEERGINFKAYYNDEPTIVKERIMAHRQQVCRINSEKKKLNKINDELKNNIIDSVKKEMEDYDFIIFSDYDKYIFGSGLAYDIIHHANSKGIKTLADIKPKNLNHFKNCTIICPNKHEAEKMSGIEYSNGPDTLYKMGCILSEKINSKYVVITCGKDGAFFYDRDKDIHKLIPTRAKEVKDETGAGDTSAAAYVLGVASGVDPIQAIELANYASGVVVGKAGTATTTKEELIEYMNIE
ncbi:bifunctional protein HldE [archaeon BMS3Abin17]|nr:bifunctional protein HldE [archaeon BMS3Abin17]HDZ60655.1 D-glycero-beta-D-manno-heptose-7-phosphate kinase [Candidatus Pacearchaeota archaeon]